MEVVKLTSKALQKAKELLDEEQEKKLEAADAGLRIAVTGGGCSGLQYSLAFKNPREDDFVHEYGEVELKVFVDPKSATYLAGSALEYHDTLEQSGFEVINPNSQSCCGCGKSFSM